MKYHLRNITLDLAERTHFMGILNVTPDSFSDGGHFTSEKSILNHVDEMVQAGVDIIDIGGESSRPFAQPVSIDEELDRVLPAIQSIRQHFSVPISIDTTKSEVAQHALDEGADIINDISACRHDPNIVNVARQYDSPIIIMHMQGTPGDMQLNPEYKNVVDETIHFFQDRITWLIQCGISKEKIIIDPGIGFGKTVDHNLTILKHAKVYQDIGCPVLIGHSRKSFIGKILGNNIEERDIPTAVLSSYLALQGTSILRVHDVKATIQAVKLMTSVNNAD